jgi:hypothetical protein
MTPIQRLVFGFAGVAGGMANTAMTAVLIFASNPHPPTGLVIGLFVTGVSSVLCSVYIALEARP